MLQLVANTTDTLLANTLEPVNGVVGPLANTTTPLLADALEPINTGVLGPVASTTDPLLDDIMALCVSSTPSRLLDRPSPHRSTRSRQSTPSRRPCSRCSKRSSLCRPQRGTTAAALMRTFPFDGLAGGMPGAEEALIISALAAAGATALQARFFLANVPPIPLTCMVGEATVRYMSAFTSVASVDRAASATGSVAGRVGTVATELGSTVRDGFLPPAGRIEDGADDEAVKTRLLMQLHPAGHADLAFLTVWFWATRLRWAPWT